MEEITKKLDLKARRKIRGLARSIWNALDPLHAKIKIQIFSKEDSMEVSVEASGKHQIRYTGFAVKVVPKATTVIVVDMGLPRAFRVEYLIFEVKSTGFKDSVTISHIELQDPSFGDSANIIVRHAFAETVCLALHLESPTAHTADFSIETKLFEEEHRSRRFLTFSV